MTTTKTTKTTTTTTTTAETISCQHCEQSLVDYHFRELDPDARAAVRAHLGACGDCARAYCQLAADLDELAPSALDAEAQPSDSARQRLRAAVAREFRPPWWRRVIAALGQRRVPAYQLVLAIALVLGLLAALSLSAWSPRGLSRGRARPEIVNSYDASTILAVDPQLL